MKSSDLFDTPNTAPADTDVMYVEVEGYGGPLDLLLDLARRQKVDLAAISVLALTEQYLAFIETVRERRVEIAADYLVMAAWLAYLKSRLMVPHTRDDEEPSGEALAALLQLRLKRLEAMRRAAGQLMARPRLGRDIHARGAPEAVALQRQRQWNATLYDLVAAYAAQRQRTRPADYAPLKRVVVSLADARDLLERLIGESGEWLALDAYLARYLGTPEEQTTLRASSFSASLELVRQGHIELRQSTAFSPLMMRRRPPSST